MKLKQLLVAGPELPQNLQSKVIMVSVAMWVTIFLLLNIGDRFLTGNPEAQIMRAEVTFLLLPLMFSMGFLALRLQTEPFRSVMIRGILTAAFMSVIAAAALPVLSM